MEAAGNGIESLSEAFSELANRYDRHAALQQEVCGRLLERTEFLRSVPGRIVDLGCGTAQSSALLKRKFRKAEVIMLDVAPGMLARARRRSRLLRPLKPVRADLGALPFAPRCADLLFSNLACSWYPDPAHLFSEFRRVIRPEGMLLFSILGTDSMTELRKALSTLDTAPQVPEFGDVLEVGDALMAAGFSEPVMDVERITLQFSDFSALADELDATGLSLLIGGWERNEAFDSKVASAYRPLLVENRYPLGFEILVGTAFGPAEGQPERTSSGEIATFSVDSLRGSRR